MDILLQGLYSLIQQVQSQMITFLQLALLVPPAIPDGVWQQLFYGTFWAYANIFSVCITIVSVSLIPLFQRAVKVAARSLMVFGFLFLLGGAVFFHLMGALQYYAYRISLAMFNINGGIHLAEIGPPSVLGVLGALADAFAMVYYVIVLILAFWVLALAFPLAVAMFLPSLVWAPVLPVCKHVFDIVLNVLWVSLTAATVCIGLFQLGKFANSTMTTTTPLGASMAFFAAFWLCKKYIVSFSKTSYRYIQNKSNQWGEFTLGTSAPDWRMYSKVNESGLNQSYANYARPQRSTAADDAADATPGYKPASKKSQLGNYMISRAVESAAIKYGAMAGPWGFIAGSALTVATHHFRNKAEIPTFGDYRTW